ncbi:Cellular morphogenesis protein (Bud22) [Penicillium bovifimosum]|uniref:Cellular morphogenesis protein (Bud22) n=1 Tax=Penicillium bovifimosum TaxID=126998 RepID=A0A9W9GT54_9EURO|nr:Cellular morphogenesis protein (Bud22) [Penicillium bovifimosum]KAJ5129517.1 Cellular morphogenesis protein (Bud22) [Penicillium bovifimosum]
MLKRKLDDVRGRAPARPSDTRKMSIHGTRLTQMFENGVVMITRALKTSRGFERQKLSRREKTAKSQKDDKALERIKEEIETLRGLDYHAVSERYLFKQLIRTKRIAETKTFKEFQEVKKVSQEGPKSTAEANILARLFKSAVVQKEIPGIMGGIKKLLRLDDAPNGTTKKEENNKDKPTKKSRKDQSGSECESEAATSKSRRGEQVFRSEQDMDISGSEESGDEDMSQFTSRLAPDSDADSESDDEEDLDDNDISDSVSRSPSPSFSGSDSPPPKKVKGVKGSTAPVQSTTFLPSLMHGGYWSGSEEATDEEGAGGKPVRKNRMGQQARRALWEKKFGAAANHIKQEQMAAKYGGRDNGWDTKRGATDGTRGGRGGRGGRRGAFGGGIGRPQRGDDSAGAPAGKFAGKPKPKPSKDDEGPLHPSWEAKRKAKEQTTAAFAGKKVTFD